MVAPESSCGPEDIVGSGHQSAAVSEPVTLSRQLCALFHPAVGGCTLCFVKPPTVVGYSILLSGGDLGRSPGVRPVVC